MKKILTLSLSLVLLASCAKNPATGQMQLNIVSDEAMEKSGHEIAQNAVLTEGGLYREMPELKTYLEERVADIVRVGEEPNKPFRLRFIHAPTVNAGAIPGYTMMYRGILLLAKNEAELMAIMGHEMGHVTARHSAQRHTKAVMTGLAMNIGLSLLGQNGSVNPQAMEQVSLISNELASVGLKTYSRKNELQSDELGLKYISKLCYDTSYVTGVYEGFGRMHALNRKLAADANLKHKETWLSKLKSTHPEPEARVKRLKTLINSYPACGSETYEDRYLKMIDGLAYGPRLQDGFGSKDRYYDPRFRFVMDMPEDWYFPNQHWLPLALGPMKQVSMSVEHYKSDPYRSAEEELMLTYPEMGDLAKVDVDGMGGTEIYTGAVEWLGHGKGQPATAFSQKQVQYVQRTFAFKDESKKDHLVMVHFTSPPSMFDVMDEDFFKIARTMKRLTKKQAKAVEPLRIKIHTVKAGESVESLSEKMEIGRHREDFFRLYNGLDAWDDVEVGQKVKLVVDPNKNMKF